MPITFPCEKCGKPLRVPDDAAGKRTRCPACGEVSTAPADDEPVFEIVEKPAAPRVDRNPRRDVVDDSPPLKLADEPLPLRTAKKKKKRRRLGQSGRVDNDTDPATKAYRNKQILYGGSGLLLIALCIPAVIHLDPTIGGSMAILGVISIYQALTGQFGDDDD